MIHTRAQHVECILNMLFMLFMSPYACMHDVATHKIFFHVRCVRRKHDIRTIIIIYVTAVLFYTRYFLVSIYNILCYLSIVIYV